ncbi:MAG: hypothetical protein ACI8RD_007552, partial [Bacillariaceae sp.]
NSDELTAPTTSADDDVVGEENDASLSDMKKMMDTTISVDGSGKKKSYWAGTDVACVLFEE